MNRLQAEYKSRVRFIAVYISEAHARDQWPAGAEASFCDAPKTIKERVALAQGFVAKHKLEWTVLVDSMHDTFQKAFAAWPFRYYVVANGKLVFKAQPHKQTHLYDIEELGPVIRELREACSLP